MIYGPALSLSKQSYNKKKPIGVVRLYPILEPIQMGPSFFLMYLEAQFITQSANAFKSFDLHYTDIAPKQLRPRVTRVGLGKHSVHETTCVRCASGEKNECGEDSCASHKSSLLGRVSKLLVIGNSFACTRCILIYNTPQLIWLML